MRNADELAAKVEAVNAANKAANELYDMLVNLFTPFVGQNLCKVDGTLLAKFQKQMPTLPCTPALSVYRSLSYYSLYWNVKACALLPPNSCIYHEVAVYVGELRDGVLTKIIPACERRTDYTLAEIQGLQETARKAKGVYEVARSALFPFNEA